MRGRSPKHASNVAPALAAGCSPQRLLADPWFVIKFYFRINVARLVPGLRVLLANVAKYSWTSTLKH